MSLTFFGKPVPVAPKVTREEMIQALLYFRYKERESGKAKLAAYNSAQAAVSVMLRTLTQSEQVAFGIPPGYSGLGQSL